MITFVLVLIPLLLVMALGAEARNRRHERRQDAVRQQRAATLRKASVVAPSERLPIAIKTARWGDDDRVRVICVCDCGFTWAMLDPKPTQQTTCNACGATASVERLQAEYRLRRRAS